MIVTAEIVSSWDRAYKAALLTAGLTPKADSPFPGSKWRLDMLRAEHSPIRLVEFDVHIRDCKYWVINHIVRHHVGIEKFVRTSRSDRNTQVKDRDALPQGNLVDCDLAINAQALISISRKRLCSCASPETRELWTAVRNAIAIVDPFVAQCMVPECLYRGFCPEPHSCKRDRKYEFRNDLALYQYKTDNRR